MKEISIIGVDLAKNVFQLHGAAAADGSVCPLEDAACTTGSIKINYLRAREGSPAVAFPPPLDLEESFSRSGCGRIFPLFSRVMRDELSTGSGARRA